MVMNTKKCFLIGVLISSLGLFSFIAAKIQDNQTPVVKIINPQNNSSFDWDAPVNYKITVSDKEDGESKFDEINIKEVLLEVRRVKKTKTPAGKMASNDQQGLNVIMTSNCINCHSFNGKALGPSFYDISKHYPATKPNIDSLVKRIKEGSSGLWPGKEKMPSHPELTVAEIKSTVQWVLKNAADPDVNYYTGTEGLFRIKAPGAPAKITYILTASYIDHGLKDVSGKRLRGQDVISIHNN
jgi:cytochrome c